MIVNCCPSWETSSPSLPALFCGWEGRRQLKMNEWVLSFHTRKRKKRGEREREAQVTRHWELQKEGELCFINTHTHTHILTHRPQQPGVDNRSLSGVCDDERLTCGVCEAPVLCGCVSVWVLSLHRLAPPVVTGGLVPLRLAPRRRPDGHGLRSNGSVQEGEAGRLGDRPAGVRFDPRVRGFTGMQQQEIEVRECLTSMVFN